MTGSHPTIDMSRQAERLVVEGVRRLMTGYATGDVGCWEMAFKLYAGELGSTRARRPSSELVHYARALHAHGSRRFCLFPYDCPKLCQDECLVVSLISAAQAGDDEALAAIGTALVSAGGLGETLLAAVEYAEALHGCGLQLQPIELSALSLEDCPLKQLVPLKAH